MDFNLILGYCFFKWKENRQHIFEYARLYFITIVISIFLFIIIILSQIKLYILDYDGMISFYCHC